ncbi:hypothetical protein [Bordetella genomosp. 8]|uniref:hypothetical protein n=1 Tax=Bordetella genomosp. 8 TaxID=1416806 RepID=UPI0012FD5106|nr:hypothetical protein [Bordetella genomosp. 8]
MRNAYSALPLILTAAVCAVLAGCGSTPSKGYSSQSQPPATASQPSYSDGSGAKPALTIQSGEGEKLNLPWFVRDIQGAVNKGSGPTTEWRSVDPPPNAPPAQ